MDGATTMLLPGVVGLSCVLVMTFQQKTVRSVMMHRKADLLRKSSANRRDSVGIR
jgi:hypothetical protein